MKIEHIAIWVKNLEATRTFYETYFEMRSNEKYVNEKKGFESYFVSFPGEKTRLEIMSRKDIGASESHRSNTFGLTHFAFSVGSKEKVDELTQKLSNDGYKIAGEPRTSGDGYYESVVEDPEGNWV